MSTKIVRAPASCCQFGIAVGDITPPVGMYHRMWGAAAHDRSTGIHRPLRATAIVMRPDATADSATAAQQTVIVALDHCLFRPPEMEELIRGVTERTGVERSQLLVTFSHTHSAGYLSRDRATLPGGDLLICYMDELPEKVAAVVNAALASVRPATLTYAATTCEMGCQRDYLDDERGHFVCGFNPDAAAPLPLNVVRVTQRGTQSVIATIVNYPCHPTTLAWQNTLISPDYIGALREVVERELHAPCLFLLAPCGDIGPRDGYVGDVTVADKNGRQVAFAALAALNGLPPAETEHVYDGPVFSGATLGAWRHDAWPPAIVESASRTRHAVLTVELAYLPSLPKLADVEQQLRNLEAQEAAARTSGNLDEATTLRTKIERLFRELHRLRPLPQRETYPCPAWTWQWGDAFWTAVEGEPYHFVQSELTRRFPQRPLIAITLANGTPPSYLPTAEAYAKSQLYQPQVAVLAPGCLETLTDAIGRQLAEWST